MTWALPATLSLLWGIPVLVGLAWWFGRRRRALLDHLGAMIDADLRDRMQNTRHLQAWLFMASVAMVIAALAQPRWGYQWQEVQREGLRIAVVLDVSRSMDAEDVSPSRLERAKRKIIDLSDALRGDRVGLVLFARGAFTRIPLTLDYRALRELVHDTHSHTITAQGSDIGAGIDIARELLGTEAQADRAIILLSDGEDQAQTAIDAAKRAADDGIHIYVIGIGKAEGAPIPLEGGGFKKGPDGEMVLTRLQEDTLKEIAAVASGAYVGATAGPQDIRGIYEGEIRGKLQGAEMGVRREKIWDERYQWPLGAAVLLLLIRHLVAPRRRRVAMPVAMAAALLLAVSARADGPEVDALIQEQLEHPGDLGVSERLGEALFQAGRYAEAEEVLRDVSATSADPEQRTRAQYNAGLAAYRSGKLTEAIRRWEDVVKQTEEHGPGQQNLEAARKELQLRMQEQPPEEQPNEDGEEGEPNEQEQGDPQEGDPQQGDGEQQEQQGEQQPSDGENERPPEENTGEVGQQGDIEPQDADTGLPQGAQGGEPTSEDLTEEEAKRFLEGLEEGTPRVTVGQPDGRGRDW